MAILKLVTRSDSEAYARDLRAIGQDLARFAPENLEIELVDNQYIAHFHARQSLIQPKPRKITVLKRVLKRLVAKKPRLSQGSSKSTLIPASVTYTAADI